MSILDGWWPEAFNGRNGWAIGNEREYDNLDAQDWDDANQMYHVLENDVLVKYFDRDAQGVPHQWLALSKEAIATCAPVFSTARMVKEYAERLYLPSMGELTVK